MKIIYFAKIRELIGKSEEEVSFPNRVKTIEDLNITIPNNQTILCITKSML